MNKYTRIEIIDAMLKVSLYIDFPYKVYNVKDLLREIEVNPHISNRLFKKELERGRND